MGDGALLLLGIVPHSYEGGEHLAMQEEGGRAAVTGHLCAAARLTHTLTHATHSLRGLCVQANCHLTHPRTRHHAGYENCVPKVIAIMDRLRSREVTPDYTYYQIPSPWLQVKCMRVLQYFPPPEDPELAKALGVTLRSIITGAWFCTCCDFRNRTMPINLAPRCSRT